MRGSQCTRTSSLEDAKSRSRRTQRCRLASGAGRKGLLARPGDLGSSTGHDLSLAAFNEAGSKIGIVTLGFCNAIVVRPSRRTCRVPETNVFRTEKIPLRRPLRPAVSGGCPEGFLEQAEPRQVISFRTQFAPLSGQQCLAQGGRTPPY